MSLTCEISGELLGNVKAEDEIVVTPSGHICIKRLLLTKLTENGGMDPFQPSGQNLPLSEDQLVTLQRPSPSSSAFGGSSSSAAASAVVPPRPQATSLPNLLSMMQQEYDALVLELFDTRKALEDTRRELSQALYQNDAAIRVVARLSQERDQARQELEQWNASVGPAPTATTTTAAAAAATTTATTSSSQNGTAPQMEEPDRKRRRIDALDPDATPLQNDIPPSVQEDMDESWKNLNAGRKAMLKAAAAEAPTPEDLATYQDVDQKAWHKSSCKGVPLMSKSGSLIVTAGKDKQIVVYHEVEQVVKETFNFGSVATCVDIASNLVVAGDSKGKITAYALTDDGSGDGMSATAKTDAGSIVDVRVHPSQNQVVASSANGTVMIFIAALEEKRLQLVTTFVKGDDNGQTEFTCGALHPDGLLYVAGTKDGALWTWDFRSKNLAAILKDESMEAADPVTCVAISENGYTFAASHASAAVRAWDMRKQKVVSTMEGMLKSVDVVAFDKSGKYLAMGGEDGVKVTTVKQWGTTATYETKMAISGVVWSKAGLEACSDKERSIHFFQRPSN